MSGTVSMWAREAIVREVFRKENLITACWVALTNTVPPANAEWQLLTEPAFGYARRQVPLDIANWGLTGYGEVYNLNEITYPTPTSKWGLIQGYALMTAATEGETIAVGSLVNPMRVDFGKAPVVKAGGIVIGLFD